MSDQWGQQPANPNQQPWSQPPSSPNQQPWGQPPINSDWQQPTFNPGQFQPPQPPPKKRRNRLWIILSIVGGVLVLSCVICSVIGSFLPKSSSTDRAAANPTVTSIATATKAAQVVQPTVKPTATPTPVPSPTPVPTETSAQIEADYKTSTINTTVAKLDKDGTADVGKDVHFTCTIVNFVKDSTGNTAGANVSNDDTASIIQVGFTSGTDITQLNTG